MNFTINSDKSIIFGAKRNEPVDRSVKFLSFSFGMTAEWDDSSKVRVYVIVKKKKKKKKKNAFFPVFR